MSKQTNVPTIEFTVYLAICHNRRWKPTAHFARLLECISQRAIGGAL